MSLLLANCSSFVAVADRAQFHYPAWFADYDLKRSAGDLPDVLPMPSLFHRCQKLSNGFLFGRGGKNSAAS